MNVLFLGSDPNLFNAESQTHQRMLAYAEQIGELHIVSGAPATATRAYPTATGSMILHGIHAPKLVLPLLLQMKARELIRKEGIEIISAQDPFEHGRAAMKAARGTSAKLHIQVHTDFLSPWYVRGKIFRGPSIPMPYLNRIRRRIADDVLPHADGIRVVSERIKGSLMQKYGARIPEPTVLPIAVSAVAPAPIALPPHAHTFALIAAGRLEPEKRIEDILYAIARIALRYPSLCLFVAGSGSQRRKLERTARRLGIADRVFFLGERGASAPGLMASAQGFIQASAYEGYSRTLIEAALARVPIITTDVGIVGEVFKGFEDVLAAPVGDPAGLAEHIITLIEKTQVRTVMIMGAEKAARAHLERYADLPALIAKDLQRVAAEPVRTV